MFAKEIISRLLVVGLLLSFNCQKTSKVTIPEMGFSMTLPTGWQADSRDKTFFYEPAKRYDNWGMVIEYQLEEGQTLREFVENTLKESEKLESMFKKMFKILGKMAGEEELEEIEEIIGTRIVSKTPRMINNLDAIEVVKEASYSVFEVYIGKEDKVIQVLFRTLPDDFSKFEPSFRKAIESIKIDD